MDPTATAIPVDPAIEDGTIDDHTDTESILSTSTASLSESVKEYREIHGRTYTQKTEYWGPNDEKQNDALDFNHFWITEFLDNKLFLAPIGETPQAALDLGTGTGIWAIDFADKFPSAEVIGIDISPIQPSWVPPNCKFQIDDFEKEWTFPEDHFDFIHARNLEACIADLPKLFEQAFAHTKPGGWIEIVEFEPEARSQTLVLDDDHIFRRWYTYLETAANQMGKPHGNASQRRLAKGLISAGYTEVVERKWTIPIGSWPAKPELKKLGICNLEFIEQSLEGFGLFLLKEVMGFTYEEVQLTLSEMRSALRNPKNTPFYYMHIVYARRPEQIDGVQGSAAASA